MGIKIVSVTNTKVKGMCHVQGYPANHDVSRPNYDPDKEQNK